MDKKTILDDFKTSLKAGDSFKVSVLRMMMAAIKNEEIEQRGDLPEEKLIEVLAREAKKRKDSILVYEKAGRSDLLEKEQKELGIIQLYLPKQLSEDEVKKIVSNKAKELGIQDKSQMGKLMGAVMPSLKGKADGAVVKKAVDAILK